MKKLVSLLLCISLCLVSLPVCVSATEAELEGDVWDGSITQPTTLLQKDGVYYYEITKCSELAYVAQNGGDWLTYNYILGNNLILNDVELTWDEDGNLTNTEELLEWTPVGKFTGQFDGAYYTIRGLYIDNASSNNIGLFAHLNGDLRNLTIENSYVNGHNNVGGFSGILDGTSWISIENCSYSGLVRGSSYVGGIVGKTGLVHLSELIVSGTVIGAGSYVGGITGYGFVNNLTSALNYATITNSGSYTGGVAGYTHFYTVSNCANMGNVTGTECVGGILAYAYGTDAKQCSNLGSIKGSVDVGGIVGLTAVFGGNPTLLNSYNSGSVQADQNVGGLIGNSVYCQLSKSYSVGEVTGTSFLGAIIGNSDHIWGRSTVSKCHYLKDETHNSTAEPFGSISGDSVDVAESESDAEMKLESTFADWDFDDIWSISPDKNGGYPYLQWQETMLSDIAVNAVQISETTLSLAEGDYAYLTATVSPANASDQSVTWSSSDKSVATVTTAGKVTAVGAGTTTITVTTTDDGYSATCTVTVTERTAKEYKINGITVRDSDGTVLNAIPTEDFLASVSITNLASDGDTLVMLASYTTEGRYTGLIWVSVKDLAEGATIEITLPIDNSDGTIAQLMAFTIASFSNLVPLGDAVSFPAQ